MGLGGPVWHASAASSGPIQLTPESLLAKALAALDGVGDATLGEWSEWTGKAYHVRRRLSADEMAMTGPVVDVRGTDEGRRRHAAALAMIPAHVRSLVPDENAP